MDTALFDWLASIGSRAFTYSLWAFVLVNGAAVAAFFITRDRALVNRWTGRLLAANLALVTTGVGVPVLTAMARIALTAVSPSLQLANPQRDKSMDELPLAPPGGRAFDR